MSTVTRKRPALVCLTPVRDEAWILQRMLDAAATWADVIVVADQQSTDGSREIAERHEKVHVVDNPARSYDEGFRQRLLLNAARALVPGPRVLVALDADEALTADATSSPDWDSVMRAPPGTVFEMRWINVLPDEPRGWIPPTWIQFGFVDDCSEHGGSVIHSSRLPYPAGAPRLSLMGPKVLHLQYLDSERMRAKQRWYETWERIRFPRKRPIQIYRQYHHMDAIDPGERHRLRDEWTDGYRRAGVDLLAPMLTPHPWDARALELIIEHGPERLRHVDIWGVDWRAVARDLGGHLPGDSVSDPRSPLDRAVHRWLARTQYRADARRTRWAQRALRLLGW